MLGIRVKYVNIEAGSIRLDVEADIAGAFGYEPGTASRRNK